MPLRVYGAIVTGDPGKPACVGLNGLENARARVELLEKLVKQASGLIEEDQKKNPSKDPVHRVFLAPEYFFARKRWQNDRFYGQDLKRWIVGRLSAISKAYPKMLIVPGTVLWTKAAVRDVMGGAAKTLQERKAIDARNKLRLATLQSKAASAWSAGNVATDADAVQTPKAKGAATMDDAKGVLAMNPAEASNRGLKIAQNTAYVLLNGKILKYHKMGNFRELEGESDAIVFQAGNVDGRFTVGGVRYGLEICLDHDIGVLTQDVDIQLIVSSYVDYKSSSDRSELLLHSSTEAPGTYPDGSGGTVKIKTEQAKFGSAVKPLGPLKGADVSVFVYEMTKVAATNALDLQGESIGEVSHIHDPDTLGLK